MRLALMVFAIGCGGGKGGAPGDGASGDGPRVACTQEAQEVPGTPLRFETFDLGFDGGPCPVTHLITSRVQLESEFGGTAPPQLDDVDFATDRIVMGSSNPILRFAALDAELTIGEEPLCQGIPPTCVAYVLRDVTADELSVLACPYTGPEPCIAP